MADGKAEAHRAGAAGREPAAAVAGPAELSGPHLVLADVRVVMMARPSVSASRRSSTCWARRPPFFGYLSGKRFRHASHCASHSSVVERLDPRDQILDDEARVAHARTDPAGASCRTPRGRRRRGSSSRSTQNSSSLPVMRSSQRAPIAMIRSQSVTALFAYAVPCMPSMPRWSGCVSSDRALAEQRVDDRRAQLLGELRDRLACAGDDRAMADVEHRSALLRWISSAAAGRATSVASACDGTV